MTDVNRTVTGSEGSTSAGSAPGSQTDPALLLQSLKEEREKRRIAEEDKTTAEAELKKLQDALASGDTSSEETKILKGQIDDLNGKIATMAEEKAFDDIKAKFPVLKDKVSEFNEFKKQYPGVDAEKVAKIFLSENDLLGTSRAPKGVERPSGGGRTASPRGYTYADIEDMRKNNFRKYSKMLKEGAFKDVSE